MKIESTAKCVAATLAAASVVAICTLGQKLQEMTVKFSIIESRMNDLSAQYDTLKQKIGTAPSVPKVSRSLDASPFLCENGWCTAEDYHFIFPRGIVIGHYNSECEYGNATLSVDGSSSLGGSNCPSGMGSVTFGAGNLAIGDYSTITGGVGNTASGVSSSVSGGYLNEASASGASVSSGYGNEAGGTYSAVSGGYGNKASVHFSSVSGGYASEARGPYSSVSGGNDNVASGDYSSVSGGSGNTASNEFSSVNGGKNNEASGFYSSVNGGDSNSASGSRSSVNGGQRNQANRPVTIKP